MGVTAGIIIALVVSVAVKDYASQLAHRTIWQFAPFYKPYMGSPLISATLPFMAVGMYVVAGVLIGSWLMAVGLPILAAMSAYSGLKAASGEIFRMMVEQDIRKGVSRDVAQIEAKSMMDFLAKRAEENTKGW